MERFLDAEHVKVGAQPINWINDDFRDLGADITLERCLAEMKEAGFAGSELGHRFPQDGRAIHALLGRFGLELASGWHSTYLATEPFEEELRRFDAHLEKLATAGARVVIVAECTHAIHSDGRTPLRFGPQRGLLDAAQWKRVTEGFDALSKHARKSGMIVAVHEHMGTVIQDAEDIDALMQSTSHVSLLVDTGHITFAGGDPLAVLKNYSPRVAHVHLKNVRPMVIADARARGFTFEQAVRAGAFTVPGDGGIDYRPIFEHLCSISYRGWLVVEAEQDPKKANPLDYAKVARAYVRQHAGV